MITRIYTNCFGNWYGNSKRLRSHHDACVGIRSRVTSKEFANLAQMHENSFPFWIAIDIDNNIRLRQARITHMSAKLQHNGDRLLDMDILTRRPPQMSWLQYGRYRIQGLDTTTYSHYLCTVGDSMVGRIDVVVDPVTNVRSVVEGIRNITDRRYRSTHRYDVGVLHITREGCTQGGRRDIYRVYVVGTRVPDLLCDATITAEEINAATIGITTNHEEIPPMDVLKKPKFRIMCMSTVAEQLESHPHAYTYGSYDAAVERARHLLETKTVQEPLVIFQSVAVVREKPMDIRVEKIPPERKSRRKTPTRKK